MEYPEQSMVTRLLIRGKLFVLEARSTARIQVTTNAELSTAC